MTATLVLATHNRHKIIEIKHLLDTLPFQVMTLDDFPDFPEVVEDAATLEGNALKKAREIYAVVSKKISDALVLADDTGLEVEALNGEPGVYSARYAGENATYTDNVTKLLREMSGKENRNAAFRTVIALVGKKPSGEYFEKVVEGNVKGRITQSPVGGGGFGYDPVFRITGMMKTYAELSTTEKNSISHRGLALRAAIEFLNMLQ
jgi:XTP/dITP diphosphohydrolase